MKETLFHDSYGYWAWKATETETDKDRKKTLTDPSSWMDWAQGFQKCTADAVSRLLRKANTTTTLNHSVITSSLKNYICSQTSDDGETEPLIGTEYLRQRRLLETFEGSGKVYEEWKKDVDQFSDTDLNFEVIVQRFLDHDRHQWHVPPTVFNSPLPIEEPLVDGLEMLGEDGEDPSVDSFQRNSLHVAAEGKQRLDYEFNDLIRELPPSVWESINAQDIFGRSVLHIACQKRWDFVAETLVDRGAGMKACTFWG